MTMDNGRKRRCLTATGTPPKPSTNQVQEKYGGGGRHIAGGVSTGAEVSRGSPGKIIGGVTRQTCAVGFSLASQHSWRPTGRALTRGARPRTTAGRSQRARLDVGSTAPLGGTLVGAWGVLVLRVRGGVDTSGRDLMMHGTLRQSATAV